MPICPPLYRPASCCSTSTIVASLYGRRRWEDARYWFHSKHAFALDASGSIAHAASRLIAGARGLAKKCLVLDLDNTPVGGVIGDDGLAGIALGHGEAGEAFVALHPLREGTEGSRRYPGCLQQRTIRRWRHLVFRDPSRQRASPGGLRRLHRQLAQQGPIIFARSQRTLNIGLDSLCSSTTTPMERDIVRRHLPEVEVIDLPEDPSGFVDAQPSTLVRGQLPSRPKTASAGPLLYADNVQRVGVRRGLRRVSVPICAD